jgi:tRNA-binding EMAP/Myf-like protein
MSYCAYITTLKGVGKHPNADRLQVGEVFGNHVIIGMDMKEGDLICYFPTDGKLGIEYATENKLIRMKDDCGNNIGGYLDPDRRHITSLKLRGEKSDGLIASLSSLSKFTDITKLKEGDQITTLNGVLICEKYIPQGRISKPMSTSKNQKKQPKITESFPFFAEHLDTSQLAYNTRQFKEGDQCYITLKLHGTSQRTAHALKETKKKLHPLVHKTLKFFGINTESKKTWEYVTGTRRVTLKNFEGGFYGGNEFRQQWHDFFVGKLHKSECVYYECVGYVNEDTLIMPECDNKKTKDKEFIKQYGDKTRFTYGCGVGQSDIYVYRMTMTNDQGYTVEYPQHLVQLRCEQMGVKYCPVLESFTYTTTDDLMERVNKYVDGADPIGKTHLREGVIVRIDNKEKFTAYKHKSFNFKVLESIIKIDDIIDMEEGESVQGQS